MKPLILATRTSLFPRGTMTTAAYLRHHPSTPITKDNERWRMAMDVGVRLSTSPLPPAICRQDAPNRRRDVMASESLRSAPPSPDEPSGHPESSSDAMAAPQSLPMTPPGVVLCRCLRQHQYDIGWIGGRRQLTFPLLPLRDDGRQTTRPSDAAEENDGRQTTRPSDVRRCRRE